MDDLKPGELAYFNVKYKDFSSEGFRMGYTINDETMEAYESIDLENFPSCNDFHGKIIQVNHGDYCTVLRKIGRPFKILTRCNWSIYDVYEVLTHESKKIQVFRYNLSKN